MTGRALALVAFAVVLAGCGTSSDARQVRVVVERFYAALRAGDGRAACAQLGRQTLQQLQSQSAQRCRAAVTRLSYRPGPVVRARVFVTSAVVDLRGGERAFLNREPAGWRLSAVGCRPSPGQPLDQPLECEVQG